MTPEVEPAPVQWRDALGPLAGILARLHRAGAARIASGDNGRTRLTGLRMANLLLQKVDYKVTRTGGGTWRRYLHPNGNLYAEFTSNATIAGFPFVHYTRGISPETGARATARGFIAVGRRAVGVIAIGRAALGAVAFGQLAVGFVGIGQLAIGLWVLGQIALGIELGIGQLASGAICIAQAGVGKWVLAQVGFGQHVWSMQGADPAAVEFFKSLAASLVSRL